MQTTIARAKTCMLDAQQRQKHCYDKRHVPSVFDVGAQVLLATTNFAFEDHWYPQAYT